MKENSYIHVYLEDYPGDEELGTILQFYGFSLDRAVPQRDPDPDEFHWRWTHPPLSGSGFSLTVLNSLYKDDQFFGRYDTFMVLEATRESSVADITMIDVVSKFLIDRYGGQIINCKTDEPNSFLCGKSFL